MQRRQSAVPAFILLLFISLLLYLLSSTIVGRVIDSTIQLAASPFRYLIIAAYAVGEGQVTPLQKLQAENTKLKVELAQLKAREKEIQALRDQFLTSSPPIQTLLPAKIIGVKAFIPGVSLPEQFVIDKGTDDGVTKDDAIIYKNNLVGKVTGVSAHASAVKILYTKNFSTTAITTATNALGISRGQGQGRIALENVILSDSLQKNDIVQTRGGVDSNGVGIPPNVVIGKIISVDKKANNLFQSATVVPLIDFSRLTLLFVVRGGK